MLMRAVVFTFLLIYSGVVFAQTMTNIPESEFLEDSTETQKDKTTKKNIKTVKTIVKENVIQKIAKPNVVILQGLNKVLGRISSIEIPLGTMARFENLEIIAHKCQKSLPEERPDNKSLLEIREVKIGEEPKQIFLGWMFSSSPSLTGLEHPVYDITVISCETRKDLENIDIQK